MGPGSTPHGDRRGRAAAQWAAIAGRARAARWREPAHGAGPLGLFPTNAWWAPRPIAGTAFAAFGASGLGLRREQRAWE